MTKSIAWWVDERVPDLSDLSDLLPVEMNAEAFAQWLGPLLGNFRGDMYVREEILSRAEQIAEAQKTKDAIDHARNALHDLSQQVDIAVAHWWHRHVRDAGEDWNTVRDRLNLDLMRAHFALGATARRLRAVAPKRGRKTQTGRDALFAAVADKLISATGIGKRPLAPRRRTFSRDAESLYPQISGRVEGTTNGGEN